VTNSNAGQRELLKFDLAERYRSKAKIGDTKTNPRPEDDALHPVPLLAGFFPVQIEIQHVS
jgi:hypothetical protein